MKTISLFGSLLFVLAALAGCRPAAPESGAAAKPHVHQNHPPHGGTPVVLGDEVYQVEFVLDAAAGDLQAFVLDGEMENFMRASSPAFTLIATVGGQPRTLTMRAVANPATGETVGDTSMFEAQADWLKTTPEFDAVLQAITIRGSTFTDVKFNFPKGNDRDG
jgi:hypothetical protein